MTRILAMLLLCASAFSAEPQLPKFDQNYIAPKVFKEDGPKFITLTAGYAFQLTIGDAVITKISVLRLIDLLKTFRLEHQFYTQSSDQKDDEKMKRNIWFATYIELEIERLQKLADALASPATNPPTK